MEEFLTQQGEPGQALPTEADNKGSSSQLSVKANTQSWWPQAALSKLGQKRVMHWAVFLKWHKNLSRALGDWFRGRGLGGSAQDWETDAPGSSSGFWLWPRSSLRPCFLISLKGVMSWWVLFPKTPWGSSVRESIPTPTKLTCMVQLESQARPRAQSTAHLVAALVLGHDHTSVPTFFTSLSPPVSMNQTSGAPLPLFWKDVSPGANYISQPVLHPGWAVDQFSSREGERKGWVTSWLGFVWSSWNFSLLLAFICLLNAKGSKALRVW